MKKLILPFLCLILVSAKAQTVDDFNIEFMAHLPFTQELSDVWGYVDEEGNEYAIVGRNAGVSIIDVTDTANLNSVGEFNGNWTVWRDIKVWNDHAYVVCDNCGNGLLIIDLSPLPQSTSLPYTYWVGDTFDFQSAHNIYIDENGIAYIFGANHSAGGAIFLDLNDDPMVPVELGKYDEHYLHDGVVRGDTMWGGAIFIGDAQVIDVSDKENPVLISSWKTPNAFTHNLWFSDDNNYIFTTDEVTDGSIGAYDVSDVMNPTEIDVWEPLEEDVIPHNTHFMNDFLITSHYTIGVSILSVLRPNNMLEVGRYDTSPNYNGDGYHGAWGAYPWLPSGKLLISDIEMGLYVLKPTYLHGCYLEGSVYDIHTGDEIFFPTIEIIEDSLVVDGDIIGNYATSVIDSGTYSLRVSADGYFETIVTGVVLQNGEVTIQDVGLSNWPTGISEHPLDFGVTVYPNPAQDAVQVRATAAIEAIRLMSVSGTMVQVASHAISSNASVMDVSGLANGIYLVEVKTAAGTKMQRLTVF
ncbi:MAG: choice-of-anchor B family protein [Flavobacteriales bacterium]|nr:choice-of-anchor B family protein [Flavobacteriales bacterium]